MKDGADITRNITHLTIGGVRKTAREWWRPEVCRWDAFRSRIKRYRDDPGRYTLTEIINKKDLGTDRRTGTRATRHKKPDANLAKKPMGIVDPMVAWAVTGKRASDLPAVEIKDTPDVLIPREIEKLFSPRMAL